VQPATRPPLICHIIYRLAVGGLENGLVNLVNHLPEDRYRHAIICLTAATDFRRRIRRADVDIYEIHKRPGKDLGAYGRVWRILRKLRPRLVHTRNLPAIDMIGPARLAGVRRFIHSEHGLDSLELDGRNRKYNRLRRLSRLFVDHYVTVSRDLNDWLTHDIGVPASRVETIYNGVDTDRFSPGGEGRSVLPPGFAPPGAVIVGTFGRLDTTKNQTGLAQAFARAVELRPALRPRLRLVIVGDGDRRDDVQDTLERAGVRDLAWLPGFRDDMPSLYRALDVFVLPSLREGISNTLLEAMASGRPVIATRVGGNPEIVPDGAGGRLVASGDIGEFAGAILDYVENPTLRRAHGDEARAHTLRNFALSAMVHGYDRVYGSLS
jgi:sugar transferase (PEP-CTERM/EpsH1 system associated)